MRSLLEMELPAAATNSISLALARLISSSRAWENAPPPQLFESTRTLAPPVAAKAALVCTANSMALIALAVVPEPEDRKSTRLNSSHGYISYAVFCLKKKKITQKIHT